MILTGPQFRVDLPPSQWGALSTAEIVVGVVWIVACVPVLFFMPGLGIALLSFSLPPLVRTALVVARRRHGGKEFSPVQKVGLFVGSAVLTALGTHYSRSLCARGDFCRMLCGNARGGRRWSRLLGWYLVESAACCWGCGVALAW